MTKKSISIFFIIVAFLISAQTLFAKKTELEKITEQQYNGLINSYAESSDCIKVRRMGRWAELSRNSLIIYASTKNKPFYVLMSGRSLDMKFVKSLRVRSGMREFCGNSYDELIIDGHRYKIQAIQALDRDTAQKLINYTKDEKTDPTKSKK